jgi:two-component system, OmpR family, response regulator
MLHNEEQNQQSKSILIVEDDRQLLEALSTRLADLGCRCTACANACEALSHFSTAKFDLIITDMTMPGIDGLGVIAMIRNQSEVPILVLTGHAGEYGPLISHYRNVTLVRKPLGPQALLTCVKSSISGGIDARVLVAT